MARGRRARLGLPGSKTGGRVFSVPPIACLCVLLSLLGGVAAPLRAQTPRELFPNTNDLGRAVIEYEDDAIHVVAAYNYSQRNHESRWLLIELGVATREVMRITSRDITLVRPDGRPVAVASQRAFAQDIQRTRLLVQNAVTTRHLHSRINGYFGSRQSERFQWFVVTLFEGIVFEFFDVDVHRTAWGDLYFASPTGAWAGGTYSLVVQGAGETRAVLPIDLD